MMMLSVNAFVIFASAALSSAFHVPSRLNGPVNKESSTKLPVVLDPSVPGIYSNSFQSLSLPHVISFKKRLHW